MEKIKKFLYVTIGIISFGLGAIGVVLPVLPTTPFLLLSSFCFVRGSERFDKWFKGTKLYKKHLESFVNNRQMTLKQKITILLFADFMLMFPLIILDSLMVKGLIVIVMLTKYWYFVFRIKTVKKEDIIKDGV
ncbi:YbaN family protein [Clostridium baratii]|uniref:YbaN family protein n=1 Tax=Clostridium baratii TaxID=1561 RepID=UPI0005F2BA00|nr:YbaN family protein [Clostridium baratii]KJU70597.1 membrane protein [Clostridium baratii]